MTKYQLFILNIILVVFYAFIGLVAYWTLYPYNPLEMNQPVQVLTKEVNPGDTIFVEFDFTKNTEIIPEISLQIVDGVVFSIPTYKPLNRVGHVEKIVGVLVVPQSIPCGEYHLSWSADYRMNPLRHVIVEYESEKFRVNSKICAE